MIPFELHRLGLLMEPEPNNPLEAEGVLNPAAVRGPDGGLYLFPRLVAKGNYSRIGIARVQFSEAGDPVSVERLGIALEPEAEYELQGEGKGGCEDARVTFVEPLKHYVMSYTALSKDGPRIALAVSDDLISWTRLGLVTFEPFENLEFEGVANKDASVFPIAVPDPDGLPSLALIHRPLFRGTRPEEKMDAGQIGVENLERESIWISYREMHVDRTDLLCLCHFTSHRRLAAPAFEWDNLKIGCGTPPVLTELGWLIITHGVHETSGHLEYSAGAMILAAGHPGVILYRSDQPILVPKLPHEREGVIANVVFPTGIDRRDDIGDPDRFDVYYGMADDRIGVATLRIPRELPGQIPTTADVLAKNNK